MKKGDLVIMKPSLSSRDQEDLFLRAPIDVWQNPGVVVRNVYEGQVHLIDRTTGKAVATELMPTIDIMVSGKVIQKVPIKYLCKVDSNEYEQSRS